MSSLMKSDCRKFSPNIFNKTKCTNCFRQKEEHSAEALESNRATRKVCKCGYLFVAPDWDFSIPINRTKRWQRRWFILYDDGELTYSVDEHPDTVPQAVISLLSPSVQSGGSIVWEAPESETGHPHSLAIAAPDRIHFVRGDTRDETRAWMNSLLAVDSPLVPQGTARIRQARHKRNATFPGGCSNLLPTGVSQQVITGTNAVSQQHSPVLRQRFNSCASPLHQHSPLIVGKEENMTINHFNLNPMGKIRSSLPLCGYSQSSSSVRKDQDDVTSCTLQSIVRSYGNETVSDSQTAEINSSSIHCKEVGNTDTFVRSTQPFSSNTRLFSEKIEKKESIKEPILFKSDQNYNVTNNSEHQENYQPISLEKNSSLPDERQASSSTCLASYKNVRGDPDGCVLDAISKSSYSDERDDHVHRSVSNKKVNILTESSENKSSKENEESSNLKCLPRKFSIRKDAIKHGWLMKLGVSKVWSKHWFVLCGTGLLYYRDPSAEGIGILDGVIDLSLVHDVQETAVERHYGIQLTTWDHKQCLLSALTPGIRTGWIEALKKSAGLPCLSHGTSLQKQQDKEMNILGSSNNIEKPDHSSYISDTLIQSKAVVTNSSEFLPTIAKSPVLTSSVSLKTDAVEMLQSSCEGSSANSDVMEHSFSSVNKKYENNLIGSRLDNSLYNDQFSSSFSLESAQKIVDALKEASPCIDSESFILDDAGIILDSKESLDKCCDTNRMAVSEIPDKSHSSESTMNIMSSVFYSQGMIHKPHAALNSHCPSNLVDRRNSHGYHLQNYDKNNSDIMVLDKTSDQRSRAQGRPNYLNLPSSESNASKSFISSSASSCSLSDEDFRTASEASQHSTPAAEGMTYRSSHLWDKSEVLNLRDGCNSLAPNSGTDIILPPSPPLNRTPISRVKERARSRVVKRTKTATEGDLNSAKIESLTKRVKELMTLLSSKESELLRQKSKESASAVSMKSPALEIESNPKISLPITSEKADENISGLKEAREDGIKSHSPKDSLDGTRLNEFQDIQIGSRRLSASSVTHPLPRMGSLSDLTNVDLDLDLNAMDRERLIEEWYSLRARFEKAVREIHALKKELRACQGCVDALELESSAISLRLAEERKRAEADMQLMVSRVQDLTIKFSASEKQVRILRQKASRVETREKRRSLSLRSDRVGRSGTDPSLCSGKLPKEIGDRLTQLECTMAAALGRSLDNLRVSTPGSDKIVNEVNKATLEEFNTACNSSITLVNDIETNVSSNILLNSANEFHSESPTEKSKSRSSSLICNTNDVQTSRTKSFGNEVDIQKFVGNGGSMTRNVHVTNKKPSERSSVSEQKGIEGRHQSITSRITERNDASLCNRSLVDEEQIEEETEDDISKKCDPLRILIRLSSLEGRVAEFFKTSTGGKKIENIVVDEYPVDVEMVHFMAGPKKTPENPCPRCINMQENMDKMKEELLLLNNDGSVMLQRYREEIEQLRALCEKGMRAMELSHQQLVKEMEEKHKEEINRVLVEKEQALREETKATLAALDAMRKAHETEVQREVAKFKEEFSRRMSAKQQSGSHHQAEMESIRREILSLSQRYSSKCVECASLREQLRIARGNEVPLNELDAYREVLFEQS